MKKLYEEMADGAVQWFRRLPAIQMSPLTAEHIDAGPLIWVHPITFRVYRLEINPSVPFGQLLSYEIEDASGCTVSLGVIYEDGTVCPVNSCVAIETDDWLKVECSGATE